MPVAEIQPVHYEAIVNRIHDGRCVPFLGAGVNAIGDGYPGLPLGGEVARMASLRQVLRGLGIDSGQACKWWRRTSWK